MDLTASVGAVLEDFLSSYDLGEPELNMTLRTTAGEVMPEVLIALFAASHLECSGEEFEDLARNERLRKFLHGLLFAVFGLHNLETLVEFEKHSPGSTLLDRSVAFCSGGLCLANASLILEDEDEKVLDAVYKVVSSSAVAELRRRRAVGRIDIAEDEYLALCRDLSSPLKLFVAAPIARAGNDEARLSAFTEMVECIDVPNRLIKELNLCFSLIGGFAKELETEQPPLLLQLGARDRALRGRIGQLVGQKATEGMLNEIRGTLLRVGAVDRVLNLIETYLARGTELTENLKNQHSKTIMRKLIEKQRSSLGYYRPMYSQ